MKALWSAFLSGGLFGAGLVVSGMTRPSKVIGFLDFLGRWDASLVLVMAGAVAVHMVLYRFILKRRSPLYDVRFHIPTRRDIDARLVLGAVLFGVGWGLGGYCPGPGLVSLGGGALPALVFVAVMAAGMRLADAAQKLLAAPAKAPPPPAADKDPAPGVAS